MSLFDRCRSVPAVEIARREGLHLTQKGSRFWTRCPLHGEKTASLCFFPDGGWKCFGCNAGGDAVTFYAALHQCGSYEAAKAIVVNARERAPTVQDLQRKVEGYRKKLMTQCREVEQNAAADMDLMKSLFPNIDPFEIPGFVEALKARDSARMNFYNIEAATARQMLENLCGNKNMLN